MFQNYMYEKNLHIQKNEQGKGDSQKWWHYHPLQDDSVVFKLDGVHGNDKENMNLAHENALAKSFY